MVMCVSFRRDTALSTARIRADAVIRLEEESEAGRAQAVVTRRYVFFFPFIFSFLAIPKSHNGACCMF